MQNRFEITNQTKVRIIYTFTNGHKRRVLVAFPHTLLENGSFEYEDELIKVKVDADINYHMIKRRTVVLNTNMSNNVIENGSFKKGTYTIEFKFLNYEEFIKSHIIQEKYPDVVYRKPDKNLGLYTSNRTKANYSVTNITKPFNGGKF
jgi:hypothetical protein